MDKPRDQLTRVALLIALVGSPLGACRPADAAGETPGELARFRAGLSEPAALTGGAPTLDALVARFIRALETRDTAALVAMHLTRAEFAWLYYPTNPRSRPPYSLSPELMWFVDQGNSEKGARRLLADRMGRPLHVIGYRCDPITSEQGKNTVLGPCVVRRRVASNVVEERLFGLIVERDGQFKFVSYANKL